MSNTLVVKESEIRGNRVSPQGFNAEKWDNFVANNPNGTAFHRTAWLKAITESLGHKAWALEALGRTGELVGVLPLVQVKSLLFGNYLVAVPFASYGGPLGTSEAVNELARHASGIAKRLGVKLLELRSRFPLESDIPQYSVSSRKLTVTLPLEGGSEAVFKSFPAKLRSQIRRSEKEGVTVTVGPNQATHFHAVYSEHMRDLGTPAMPESFFSSLSEHFGDDMIYAIAYSEDVPIACGAGFLYGSEFEITWASSLRAYNRIAPNMAMYWQLIAHIADRGTSTFNFGRCTEGSGTHKFKRQWGAVDEPLAWYQWNPGNAPASTPAPGGKFSLAQQVWTRLPLPVSRTLGPKLARLLP